MHPIDTPYTDILKSVPSTNPPGLSIPGSALDSAQLDSAPSLPRPRLLTQPATCDGFLEHTVRQPRTWWHQMLACTGILTTRPSRSTPPGQALATQGDQAVPYCTQHRLPVLSYPSPGSL